MHLLLRAIKTCFRPLQPARTPVPPCALLSHGGQHGIQPDDACMKQEQQQQHLAKCSSLMEMWCRAAAVPVMFTQVGGGRVCSGAHQFPGYLA